MKTEVEDWLTELPPLDGDDDEEPQGDADGVDELIPKSEDGETLDDAASDGLVVDDGIALGDEHDESADDGEPWEADVGEPELDIDERDENVGADGDAPGIADADLPSEDDPAPSLDDGGEEGTTDPIDQPLDEHLPELDADDHGDFEDALLREAGLVEAELQDAELPRWADAAWREHPGSCRSIPIATGVGAPRAFIFDPRPGGAIVLLAPSEGLLVSTDGGATARAQNGWREAMRAHARGHETMTMVALAPVSRKGQGRTLWGATNGGLLLKGKDFGSSWEVAGARFGSAVALAVSVDGSLTALSDHASALELLSSADGTRWFTERLPIGAARYRDGPTKPWLVRSGVALAIGHPSGVLLSRDGARSFSPVPGTSGAVAAAFAGETSTAPLVVAVRREAENKTYLVRAARDGDSEVVAEIGDPEGAPEADAAGDVLEISRVALLWDSAEHVLWVAVGDRASAFG